ncbi:hypothetical protein QYF36_025410 [Acer negundo]|nr:hypothetical protein QYF36_025410 [Acer negundo]
MFQVCTGAKSEQNWQQGSMLELFRSLGFLQSSRTSRFRILLAPVMLNFPSDLKGLHIPMVPFQVVLQETHDGERFSSMQPSLVESPSHPSFGRHSRNSSTSKFSGNFKSSSGPKGTRSKRKVNG